MLFKDFKKEDDSAKISQPRESINSDDMKIQLKRKATT